MATHYIGRHRAWTVPELHVLLGGRRSQTMIYMDARRGVLNVEGGAGGRYVTEPAARAYAARLGVDFEALLAARDAVDAERERLISEQRARAEREQLEGIERYYRSLRGDDGSTEPEEGEEREPSLAESVAAAREQWDAECARKDREREAEERAARREIERETRERQEAEIARLARELEERTARTEAAP